MDVRVNCAGVNVFSDPLKMTEEDWRRCFAIDLDGAWYGRNTMAIGGNQEAALLAGVSLSGGVGMMRYGIAGVLILAIIESAMNLKNLDTFYQYVIRGSILLLAVVIDRLKQRQHCG